MRFGEPSDEDRAAWIARLRRQIARDMPAASTPFTVLGLAAPRLTPAALAEWHEQNGEMYEVELVFGDELAPAGPFVSVRSLAGGGGGQQGLADMVADERARLADLTGVDEPAGGPQFAAVALLALDGAPLVVTVRREDGVWAAAFATPGGGWTGVVARGLPVTGFELTTVTDLGPFRQAREALLGRVVARITAPAQPAQPAGPAPPPEPAPAGGAAAHETLVAATLADHEAFRAAEPGSRRRPAGGITSPRMWELAIRSQMVLTGQDRATAEAAVTSMVNHLVALSEQPWFGEDRLRAAATAETIGSTAFGLHARSEPAQRAWAVIWQPSGRRALVDPIAEATVGRSEWDAAWLRWADTER